MLLLLFSHLCYNQSCLSLFETTLTGLAVLLRIFSNSAANVFQKKLTAKGQHPLLVNFLTYLFLSLICLLFAFSVKWTALPKTFWLYAVLGGVAGALGNGFLVKALQHGDLSVLGPINAYKSVVGMVVGIFLLGEVPNLWGLLGVALIVYGSYFVLGTTDEGVSWALLRRPEIQCRIWALVLTAIEAVFVKKVILASSVLVAFIGWCWFGALFSFLLLLITRLHFKAEFAKVGKAALTPYLLLVLCIGTMQATTNYAFAHMPVGYALSLFQLSTMVSVMLGHRLFGEKEVWKKLIGAFIMLIGSVLIILLQGK